MTDSNKSDRQIIEDEMSQPNVDALNQFAEVLTTTLLEKDLTQADAFEYYAHRLRTHLYSDQAAFEARFSQGYQVLLEELERESIP